MNGVKKHGPKCEIVYVSVRCRLKQWCKLTYFTNSYAILSSNSIILDLTVVLNCAIDGVWINFLDDFGERFRERSVR